MLDLCSEPYIHENGFGNLLTIKQIKNNIKPKPLGLYRSAKMKSDIICPEIDILILLIINHVNSLFLIITMTGNDSLISPCACSGSTKYVHKSCLKTWTGIKGSIYCEICNHKYNKEYVRIPCCMVSVTFFFFFLTV